MVKERSHWWDFVKTMTTRNMRFSRPGCFTPQKKPGFHFTKDWVGSRTDLDWCAKSRHPPPTRVRTPNRPACSESYRLDYTDLRSVDRRNFLTSRITVYTSVSRFDISSCYLANRRIYRTVNNKNLLTYSTVQSPS